MSSEFLEFWARIAPFMAIVTFVAIVAIPIVLLMIWNRMGHLTDQARTASAARQPASRASIVREAPKAVENRFIAPKANSTPRPSTDTGENNCAATVAIARRLDEATPKAPGPPQEEKFFLLIDHEAKGPFPRETVLRRLEERQIPPDTLCRPTDTMEWMPVEKLTKPLPDVGCSACGGPAGPDEMDQTSGKFICARCRRSMPTKIGNTARNPSTT